MVAVASAAMPGKKFCKKVSAKRLLLNNAKQGEHSAWAEHGLGLQDMHGALARDHIDLEVSQNQVDREVNSFVHSRLPEAEDEEETGDSHQDGAACTHTCQCRYGFCKQDAWFAKADQLAFELKQLTLGLKLAAGTLVLLQPVVAGGAGVPPVAAYFLGVLCQKPLVHILVAAWEREGKHSVVAQGRALPDCATSHKVFRDMLQSCGRHLLRVEVKVMNYTFEHGLWSIERLEVAAREVSHTCSFVIDKPPTSSAKKRLELPFGLKPKPRKRRQAVNRRGRGGQRGRQRGRGRGARHAKQPHSGGNEPDGLDSVQSTDASDSSDGSDPEGDLDLDGGLEAEPAESLAMPTVQAEQEARSLAQVAGEFVEYQDQRATLAAAHRAGGLQRARGSSYFVLQIGFVDGSVAPTGRSECYHCKQKIAKGSVRFSYFWSETKPSRYIHDFCALPFVQEQPQARKAQAVRAIQAIVDSTETADVRSAAEELLSKFTASASSASASSSAR